ncbi:MAG TPA: hypothetical protein VJJ26_01830 [Candidatus Babeliales bacterium]|nr:hypothetical protein [Candidatus Babeliales bacterium]
MNNQKGFSLLSFLLYLMLFSLITLFSCHIITSLIIPSLSAMRKCQSIIALHIASDLFVRDIRTKRGCKYDWKLITPHELIWHQDDHDIGWCFSGNRLNRKEGIYDKGWKKSTASIIAHGIAQAVFAIEKNNDHIVGIELSLTSQSNPKSPVICYVAILEQEKT